jgi:hypothetical protein
MIGDKGAGSRVGAPSLGALVLIASAIGVLALAFAYTGGWLSPGRLTPDRMVAALSDRGGNPLGHRRNHAKGICFTGEFEANGDGGRLSTAPMLTAGRYPVIGRFAIAVGNPDAPDATGRVRSMAVRIHDGNGAPLIERQKVARVSDATGGQPIWFDYGYPRNLRSTAGWREDSRADEFGSFSREFCGDR